LDSASGSLLLPIVKLDLHKPPAWRTKAVLQQDYMGSGVDLTYPHDDDEFMTGGTRPHASASLYGPFDEAHESLWKVHYRGTIVKRQTLGIAAATDRQRATTIRNEI